MSRSSEPPGLRGEMKIALALPWLDLPLAFPFRTLVYIRFNILARDSSHRYSQSQYRAGHRNVANAAYEDGDGEVLTNEKKISKTSSRPMARRCLKK
jgi:hypothetical protein